MRCCFWACFRDSGFGVMQLSFGVSAGSEGKERTFHAVRITYW